MPARFLTPAEARQDAADRLVGRRTLLALRVVLVISAVVWGTAGLLTTLTWGGSTPRSSPWSPWRCGGLPPIAALVAIIACRWPARRQMMWMREAINATAGVGVLWGGLGVAFGHYLELRLVAVPVSSVALACGLTALVLHYRWRTPKAP